MLKDTGIVHENVNARRLLHPSGATRRGCNIRRHPACAPANLLCRGFYGSFAASINDDTRAFLRQEPGDCEPDPFG
jgi:hypothetical protein